ncbi:MAG: 50S ribosomal protein L24 [Clostridia bacterium]|jgi:large subunit ribosomal protein L24
MHVKKGDSVIILNGNDAGKEGKIVTVDSKKGTVIVEKANMGKKHVKPKKAGQAGGIIDFERPIDASNVMLICPKCKQPSKTEMTFDKDGNKQRTCKKCAAVINTVSEK